MSLLDKEKVVDSQDKIVITSHKGMCSLISTLIRRKIRISYLKIVRVRYLMMQLILIMRNLKGKRGIIGSFRM